MTKEPKNRIKIESSEEQLQVTEACQKMLEATDCDYMACLFPTKEGAEEIVKAKVNTMNLVGHFNSIAERTAERLGVTREKALISMAATGTFTTNCIRLD